MTSSLKRSPQVTSDNAVFNASVASIISNIVGTSSVHPLDTVRVRVQLQRKSVTARSMLLKTLKFEGVRGLYKGITQPLFGAVPVKAIGFTATDYCKRELAQYYPQMSSTELCFYAAAFAGAANSFAIAPLDLLKCRAQ